MTTSSPPRGWKTVRPWTPRLALHVREISPVSATFVLSSSLRNDEEDIDDISDHAGPSTQPFPTSKMSISDLLGRGLAVKVNGSPWQRVVMHIDDDTDEDAIVILYGLLPGRQYDIELAVIAGEESIRGKITTEGASESDNEYVETDLEDEVQPIIPTTISATIQPITPAATRPPSPDPPSPPRPPLTVEERAAQLLHTITSLDAEKEALVARLKTARRESQRADAALRSEIEALKRATEKSAQADQRSKQRILALQEATKQLLAASVEADEQVKVVESSLPQLEERARAVEQEYASVQEEAKTLRQETEQSLRADKRRVTDLEQELAGLVHRLEKLSNKKDKLVTETVPELEQQLADLSREVEDVERSTADADSAGNPLHTLSTPPLLSNVPVDYETSHQAYNGNGLSAHTSASPTLITLSSNPSRPIQPIGRPVNGTSIASTNSAFRAPLPL